MTWIGFKMSCSFQSYVAAPGPSIYYARIQVRFVGSAVSPLFRLLPDAVRIVRHHHAELTSTNDEARRLAEEGAPEGTVVTADHQAAGRGRYGRPWHSRPGENVLLSVVLRPPWPARLAGLLTMAGAVAAAETIESVAGVSAQIKWPNDVLIRGRKVSGMLLESAIDGDASSPPRFVILGIGVNVNQTQFPAGLRHTATSLLTEIGRTLDREEVVTGVLTSLETHYRSIGSDEGAALHRAFVARLVGVGQRVEIRFRGRQSVSEGRIVGVASDGALELELEDGRRDRFHAGEVSLAGELLNTST